MSFIWHKLEDEGRPPFEALVLIALLSDFFALYLTVMFSWKVFDHPILAVILLSMLAVGGTFFSAAIYGEYLSRPLLAMFLLITQGLSLLAWTYFQHLPLSLLLQPAKMLGKHSGWAIASFAAGFMPVPWVERLCRLSRSPKQKTIGLSSEPLSAFDEAFQESWGKVLMPVPDDNGLERGVSVFWQNEWTKWRQTMVWLILSVLGIAAIAHRGVQNGIRIILGQVFLFGIIATGFLMMVFGFYLYKRAVWIGEDMDVSLMASRPWLRWFGRIVAALIIISLLMPAGFAVSFHQGKLTFTREEVQQLSKAKMSMNTMKRSDELINKLFGGILGGSLASLMFFMVLVVLFAPLLIVLAFLLNLDFRKLGVLSKILTKLVRFWHELWFGVVRWGREGLGKQWLRRRADSDLENLNIKRKKTIFSWGKGPKAIIRRGYYHLVEEAKSQGMPLLKHQTPGEIAETLKRMLPEDQPDLDNITDTYRAARYGATSPETATISFFEQLRRTLQGKLKRPK